MVQVSFQKAMNKRKVWVESLFDEAKDWHGLRRFRLRLLWRVNIEALRTVWPACPSTACPFPCDLA